MTAFAGLPMAFKTLIAILFFLTMITGICTLIFTGGKKGYAEKFLLAACTLVMATMLLLYASVIPAERAKPEIPSVSLWFEKQPVVFPLILWLAIAAFFLKVIWGEHRRYQNAVTASSVKESLDRLETGLCFSYPNGMVLLINHRMNELSHALFSTALRNANRFWDALTGGETSEGVTRLAGGEAPVFRLPDGTVRSFRREELDGVIQITAADTTRQHQMLEELENKHKELEEMNARIRSYGDQVDRYVAARERLETRVNLHGFLGQALLMTRHYLQYGSGSAKKLIDIWQRNIDVLRLEAEPGQEPDSLASLQNAAGAIGMKVHIEGTLPENAGIRKLIAVVGAETLTNAVRHAGARQLWIRVEETEEESVIRYTNDGSVPEGPVREGGGLSTARKKIEAAGGRMFTETSPRFMLTVVFEKGDAKDV